MPPLEGTYGIGLLEELEEFLLRQPLSSPRLSRTRESPRPTEEMPTVS